MSRCACGKPKGIRALTCVLCRRPEPRCYCGKPVQDVRTKFCAEHRVEHARKKNTEYCRAFRHKHGTLPKQARLDETAAIEAQLARLDAERRRRRIA